MNTTVKNEARLHAQRDARAVKRAEERWQKGLASEHERNGYDPRNHRGSRA